LDLSRIFWDTNLFIYLFEDYGELTQTVAELRRRMIDRGDQLFTSTLTLGEILVKPHEKGDHELAKSYERALQATASIIPLDHHAAIRYASLRLDRSLKGPDAIQLACAAQAQTDLFITNDQRLAGQIVSGIQFVTSLQRAFL
jgi:predicted nucleic acid-binding protein